MPWIQDPAGPIVSSSLLGNAIALAVLGWKTAYDVWMNERRFRRETDGVTDLNELRKRVEEKRERARTTTIITFAVLALSYLIFIVGDLYNV